MATLVSSLLGDSGEALARMQRMVIVASACSPETVACLQALREADGRIKLIVEERRRGKADAINKILSSLETPTILLVNSDARPEPGAIARLLSTMGSDEKIGAVSAVPVPEERTGLMSSLLGLMWGAHNDCSVALNHMNISNHACDELVLFRKSAISALPNNTVNDGAFFAGTARLRGYSIKVSAGARVRIKTPGRITDVISQRRRILFGHLQVWQRIGAPPKTIESLLFISPTTSLSLLVSTLARRPRSILALPVALVSETCAVILSILDTVRSTQAHTVWRRIS